MQITPVVLLLTLGGMGYSAAQATESYRETTAARDGGLQHNPGRQPGGLSEDRAYHATPIPVCVTCVAATPVPPALLEGSREREGA